MWRRALKRLAADPHVLLAVAVVLAAMVIEWASQGDTLLVAVPSLAFLGVQVGLGLGRRLGPSEARDAARLLFALAVVLWMIVGSGDTSTLPLASLVIPIVAMAAALGTRQVVVVAGAVVVAALSVYFIPAFSNPTTHQHTT